MARNWRFSSKLLGLSILRRAVSKTGGTVIPFKAITANDCQRPALSPRGHTLLVRSDQPDANEKVTHAERSNQPRRHFSNTKPGRQEARNFIRTLLNQYGVIVHNLSQPRKNVQAHGRLFIAPNGTVWLYLAKPVAHTTFARWEHRLVQKFKLFPAKTGFKPQKPGNKAIETCRQVAQNIYRIAQQIDSKDIVRTAFVIYKNAQNKPEFYDLLFIEGLKKPTSKIF